MSNFRIVGIGASAGGYAALKSFLTNLPVQPDMAFLIIQHISQQYANITTEMLAQHTSLAVLEAKDKMAIENNTIYLMPMDHSLIIIDHSFRYDRNAGHTALTHSIDTIFISLANAYKEKAVGIILSGKGTDGSRGIRSIAEAGGIVMVQSPESAEFASMPQVAISTGYVDLVMLAEEMGAKILDIVHINNHNKPKEMSINISTEIADVHNIIELLSEYSGVDFNQYKINSLVRRIEKRMAMTNHEQAREYFLFLKQNKNELNTLFKKSLIGVTEFFRDYEAFQSFESKVIPYLFKDKDQYEQLRLWVPACATGEEAYSFAMLLEAYIRDHQLKIDYKIFATDLDPNALEFASQGRYPEEALKSVSDDIVKRFFLKEGSFYSIDPHIRKKILFVKHNLLKDPPFIRLDVVSCRNLFIYLKAEAQRKISGIFHYALKTGGIFILGNNEYLEESEVGFEKIDGKNRIFQNLAVDKHKHHHLEHHLNMPPKKQFKSIAPQQALIMEHHQVDEKIAERLLDAYVPTSVVINQQMDILYLHGDVGRFMQLPQKMMSLKLSKMIAPQLLPIIKNGIKKLADGQRSVLYKDVPIQKGGQTELSNINFKRLEKQADSGTLFLIEFGNLPNQADMAIKVGEIHSEDFNKEYIHDLESELHTARQELMSISQELDASREELQASNEEMLSSNEELQSTNEELQSSNEELFSVNSELKRKIEELTTLNHDINNLFESTDIAIIFLDENLNIRKFTPSVKVQFKLRDKDTARPLTDFNQNFEDKNFEKNLLRVLQSGKVVEKEVRNQNGRYYMLRIIPYLEDDENGSGVVITFVDISEQKLANDQLKSLANDLRRSETNLQSLVNNTPDVIIRYGHDLQHLYVSNSATSIFQQKLEESKSFDAYEAKLLSHEDASRMQKKLLNVLKSGRGEDFYTSIHREERTIYLYVKLVAEYNDQGDEIQSVLAIARDITPLKQAELRLKAKNDELEKINKYLDEFVYAIAHDLRAPVANLISIMELFKNAESDRKMELIGLLSKSVNQLDFTLNGLVDIIDAQEVGSKNGVPCQFDEIVEGIKDELEVEIVNSGARLHTDFEEAQEIIYNKPYLYSIIRNLISNAIKYSKEDQTPHISLKTKPHSHGKVLLRVSDDGRGIDLEQYGSDLFKPFKRFDSNTKGKGIGLHIIKNMIERNGGSIEVESEVNQGTTFNILLNAY